MRRRLLVVVNEAGYYVSHRLSHGLAAQGEGWEVHVATPAGPAQQAIREAGLIVHSLPLTRSSLRPDRELRAVLQTWRLMRALRPDLVHCVALKATVIAGLAARLAGVPGRVLAIAGLGHVFTELGWKNLALRLGFRILLPLLAAGNARIIVQNQDDAKRLAFTPAMSERIALIPGSGVSLEALRPSPEPEGVPSVLLASRMIWTKGVAEYVEAARLLKARGLSVRFLLAGRGDPGNPASVPDQQLKNWNRGGLVEWLGFRDDMASLLADSHIACLPSYYREGLPKSLIEAAAAGRPIVTTDQPGCRDVVREGENGFLVPPRDPRALADALAKLIEQPALRRRFGARSREIASSEFDLARIIEATLSLYRDLIPEHDEQEPSGQAKKQGSRA